LLATVVAEHYLHCGGTGPTLPHAGREVLVQADTGRRLR
jgi:hypothetical protein